MTIQPGHLYQVSISDRGSGTVKVINQDGYGLVTATIIHGRFKNRIVLSRVNVDGDLLCFYANRKGVEVSPIELKGK